MITGCARVWLLCLLTATACSGEEGGEQTTIVETIESPAEESNAPLGAKAVASPMQEALVFEERWCVPERCTEAGGLMRGIPMEETVGYCDWVPDMMHAERNPIPCDPCGFDLDLEVTRHARAAGYADACCYEVSTPTY